MALLEGQAPYEANSLNMDNADSDDARSEYDSDDARADQEVYDNFASDEESGPLY